MGIHCLIKIRKLAFRLVTFVNCEENWLRVNYHRGLSRITKIFRSGEMNAIPCQKPNL